MPVTTDAVLAEKGYVQLEDPQSPIGTGRIR
jgi:hypothetical protein